MSDKFLNTGGGAINLSNGTTTIFGSTIGAINLEPSQPLKTNSVKQIVSEKLDIADINNLQSELSIKDELSFIEDDTHTTPANGRVKLYVKTDGNFYKKDDQGNETGFGGGGGINTSNAPVADNSLVVYDGTTGNTVKYVAGLKYDSVNNTLEVNDLETSNHFSLNDELQKISNITSATQGTPNITVFDGEIDVKVIKSASHNVELEFDNNDATLIADGDIELVTAAGNIQINGNSISFLGPNIDYNGDDIEFVKKRTASSYSLGGSNNNTSTGINNISIGDTSLSSVTSGFGNVCLGTNAGNSITTGELNVFIGQQTGDSDIDDIKNTGIGFNALTQGGQNRTAIGASSRCSQDNQVCIGDIGVTEIVNTANNLCNLGSTTQSFKDLYLGGKVNCTEFELGGTGSIQRPFTITNPTFNKSLQIERQGNGMGINFLSGALVPSYINSFNNDLNLYTTGNLGLNVSGTVTGMPYDVSFACSNEITTITTTGEKMRIRCPRTFRTTKIKVSVNSANGSSGFTVDIKKNGTSIQSVNQGINLVSNTSNVTDILEDDIITVEVSNVGNSDAIGLKVYLIGKTS